MDLEALPLRGKRRRRRLRWLLREPKILEYDLGDDRRLVRSRT